MTKERFALHSGKWLIHCQLFSHMSVVCFLILYRVRRNRQHFESGVNLVTHVQEWQVEEKAWTEGGERFDLKQIYCVVFSF